jgi:putative transposase
MSHSFVSCLMHCVFSTKKREPLITPAIADRLWPYMGGIARENDMKALSIGGVEDHVHILLSLPSTMAIAKAMQLIKGRSSSWMRDAFPQAPFEWQEGYGAFSVSVSGTADTIAYIENQREHHHRATFREEFLAFLKRHGMEYDERYIFD